MTLWLLRPVKDAPPWCRSQVDKAFGFVVRAETKAQARALAASEAGDEGEGAWLDPLLSSCVKLSPLGKCTVIVRDFNAG